jgi:hypothetical protein
MTFLHWYERSEYQEGTALKINLPQGLRFTSERDKFEKKKRLV